MLKLRPLTVAILDRDRVYIYIAVLINLCFCTLYKFNLQPGFKVDFYFYFDGEMISMLSLSAVDLEF
jgi:hypothetical protein